MLFPVGSSPEEAVVNLGSDEARTLSEPEPHQPAGGPETPPQGYHAQGPPYSPPPAPTQQPTPKSKKAQATSGCRKARGGACTPVALIAVAIVLGLLFLASAGYNVFQHMSHQTAEADFEQQISRRDSDISRLDRQVEDLGSEISGLNNEITAKDSQIADLQRQSSDYLADLAELLELSGEFEAALEGAMEYHVRAGLFDTIYDFLSLGDGGYASESFRATDSVLILSEDYPTGLLGITADFGEPVSVTFSTTGTAASIIWSDNWDGFTTYAFVEPSQPGVTIATFTNDLNAQSFRVLVIVME